MSEPRWVYLDNNATTQPAPSVVEAVEMMHRELWANPSSVHRFGQRVRQKIELARQSVAALIGARPRELIFTSGGTESNNLALSGLWAGPGPRTLITSRVEHSAIRQPAEAMASEGVNLHWLEVDGHGAVAPEDVLRTAQSAAAEGSGTVVVSIQWANNETGLIQPIEAIASGLRQLRSSLQQRGVRARLVLHVDATQAVGKIPVDVQAAGVDLLTLAAHKFHGPKGIGALYVRAGLRLRAMQRGGPQEREQRGGTENTAGIVGMGVAAELATAFLSEPGRAQTQRDLRDRFERTVVAALPTTVIHAADDATHRRLWNTSNLGFPGLEAEAILLGLSERGVCASAGAACSSGSLEPSPVLLAMGMPEPVAHGSVRFSLSRDTTPDEIAAAAAAVIEVVGRLSRTMPLGMRD